MSFSRCATCKEVHDRWSECSEPRSTDVDSYDNYADADDEES